MNKPQAVSMLLVICALLSPVLAQNANRKPRHSPEHNAMIKKCKDDYAAAEKAAWNLKGKEHKDALAAAKQQKKECIYSAPK
jgi:hypothetical protein